MVRKIDIYRQDNDDINWARLGVNRVILIVNDERQLTVRRLLEIKL